MATQTFQTSTIDGTWSFVNKTVDGTITNVSITGDSYITITSETHSGNTFSAYGTCQPDIFVRITATVTYSTQPEPVYHTITTIGASGGPGRVQEGRTYGGTLSLTQSEKLIDTITFSGGGSGVRFSYSILEGQTSASYTLSNVTADGTITVTSKNKTYIVHSYKYDIVSGSYLGENQTEVAAGTWAVTLFRPALDPTGYKLVSSYPAYTGNITVPDRTSINFSYYNGVVSQTDQATSPRQQVTQENVKDIIKNKIRNALPTSVTFGNWSTFSVLEGSFPILGSGEVAGRYEIQTTITGVPTSSLIGTYRYKLEAYQPDRYNLYRQRVLDGVEQTAELYERLEVDTWITPGQAPYKLPNTYTTGTTTYVLDHWSPANDFSLQQDTTIKYYYYSESKGGSIDVDMTDYVVEKGIYDTKEAGRGGSYSDNYTPNIRKNLAYYVRGQKDIRGLSISTQTNWLGISKAVIEQWEQIILTKVKHIAQSRAGISIQPEDRKKWRFKIEYTSLGEQTYRISRGTDYQRIRNNMVRNNNQDNSSVDVDKFVTFNTNKLNRLSNKAIMIQQRGAEFDEISDMFQTFDDKYVIFSKDIVFNRRSVDVDYLATENYVFANYFTSINSQKRNFEAVDNSQSVKRAESKKIYYELGFEQPDENIDFKTVLYSNTRLSPVLNQSNNERNLKLYALSPFINAKRYSQLLGEDSRTIKVLTSDNIQSDDSDFSYKNWLCTPGTMQCVNNIVTYNMQLDDTTNAGFKAEWHDKNNNEDYPVAGYYNTGVEYNADKNRRRFKYLSIMLGGHKYIDELVLKGNSSKPLIESAAERLPVNVDANTTQATEGATQVFALPMYKDNAEKLGLAMNFEWVSNNSDIEILEPAEQSLYKVSSNYRNIELKNLTEYFSNTPFNSTTLITGGDMGLIESSGPTSLGQGVSVGVYLSNNLYYADSSKTTRIRGILNTGDNPDQYAFVYDLDNDKMLLRNLRGNGLDVITYTDEIEPELGDVFYFCRTSQSIKVRDEYIYNGFNESQKAIYCNVYSSMNENNTPSIINITGGTGSINITNGTLTITPTSGANEITINNSIRIKNVQQHLTQGQLVLYLKVKDYFV